MIIIAVHGPMGSGKTTITNMLKEKFTNQLKEVVVLPFAKPLKDAAKALGWNGEKDAKGRRLLQLLGTECGRKCIDDNLWVNKWRHVVDSIEHEFDVVICDDLRFLNEHTAVKSYSLYHRVMTIKLNGRGYARSTWWRNLCWHIRSILGLLHPSERPLPNYIFDEVVDNSGDMNALTAQVERLMARIGS